MTILEEKKNNQTHQIGNGAKSGRCRFVAVGFFAAAAWPCHAHLWSS